MAGQIWVRVDFRLLHGMVVMKWIRQLNVKKAVIIDDEVYNDEFIRQIFELAKPTALELEFLTFELAGQAWDSGDFKTGSHGNTLVLIKTIDNAKKIFDAGFKYDKLTIGNMVSAPGKCCVNRVFFMNRADIDTLDGIAERGVQIEFKELPETREVSLETLKSKHLNSLK